MEMNNSSASTSLPTQLLAKLLADLDDETVTAIILHGSYARGEALPPYSDIDLVRILYEREERKQLKRFIWYDGYLLNLSSRPLSLYKEWITIPQEALFRVSTIRDARILLDKDGVFRAFQQEVFTHWKWEPLQEAAHIYASQLLIELSDAILRTLGALESHKRVMLVERIILHILPTVTEAIGVGMGIQIQGNQYLTQLQEHIGLSSAWTQFYMQAAGVAADHITLEQRAVSALRLYQETVQLLWSHLVPEHRQTIEMLLQRIHRVLEKQIT